MKATIQSPICSELHIDQQREQEIRKHLPDEGESVDAAAVFHAALGRNARQDIMYARHERDVRLRDGGFAGYEPARGIASPARAQAV